MLIEHRADPNIKNEFDRIPFEEALQNGFANVAEVLAPVSKLSDDKVYTSLQDIPEGEEYKQEGDDLFGDGENVQMEEQ